MKKGTYKLFAVVLVLALTLPFFMASTAMAAVDAPTLNKTSVNVKGVGKKRVVKINNLPAGSTVVWSSADKTIAKVVKNKKSNGRVRGKKLGKTTVTCRITTTDNKVYSLNCAVKVKAAAATTDNPAASISISNAVPDSTNNAYTITIGESFTFKADLKAKNTASACTDSVFWAIADTSIATVSDSGALKPLKAGNTTLTAYAGKTKAAALAGVVKTSIAICVKSPETKVESLTLAYSQELVVSFNQPMNPDSIFDASTKKILSQSISINGKTVNGTDAKTVGTLTGKLSDDKKTLFIDNTNQFKGTYSIILTDQVKSQAGASLVTYTEERKLVDEMGPSYEGTTMDDAGTTSLIHFNEPVDISKLSVMNAVKANGTVIFSGTSYLQTASNYKLSADKKTLSIDLSSLLGTDQNCEIKVDFYGLMDLSGNASTAYPMTVTLCTNTANKTEAKCSSMYRNGNSIVAVYDQSLQTAGYATVNGITLTGVVNPDNKKVGLYHLESDGLKSLSGQQSVTVSNFSVFSASTSSNTTYTASVNFSQAGTMPEVTGSSFTTKIVNGSRQNVLELTYDRTVKLNNTSGNMTATVITDGTVGTSNSYAYTATVEGRVVTVMLNGSFIGDSTYNFAVPAGFVTDYYYNLSNAKTVSAKKDTGDATALPAPVRVQLCSTNKKVVYVTFKTMVDMTTAQTVANYGISGMTVTNATLVSNNVGSPAVVELTLSNAITSLGVPYQVTIKNISGYKGEYSVMSDYKEMITLGQNQTLDCTQQVVSAANNKVTLYFENNVNSGSKISFIYTGVNKTYTLKGIPVISDNSVTFTFNETFVQGTSITFTPATDNAIMDADQRYFLNIPMTIQIN